MSEPVILTHTMEDGTVERMLLEQIFAAPNGREYAALLALHEDGTWDDERPIELLRAVPSVNEDGNAIYTLAMIESEDEFLLVRDTYVQSFAGISDEEDDEEIRPCDTVPHLLLDDEDHYIIDFLEVNDRKYIALGKTAEAAQDEITVLLCRFSAEEDGDAGKTVISPIPTANEYEPVFALFSERQKNGDAWLTIHTCRFVNNY